MLISFGAHLRCQGPIPVVLLQLEDDHLSKFHVNFIWYDLLRNSKHNFGLFLFVLKKHLWPCNKSYRKLNLTILSSYTRLVENSRNPLDKSQFLY